MTDTADIFDAHGRRYEAERRRLVPPYDAFYGDREKRDLFAVLAARRAG